MKLIFLETSAGEQYPGFCASHIAPHFTPVHDEIAPALAEKGITVAYDGMVVVS